VNGDGTINGAGNNRPGEPEDWEKTDTSDRRFKWASRPLPANVKIPMTFHHIMPWSRIWNGWNAVVESRSWDALSAWCYIMRVDVSDQIIARLKADPEQGMSAPLAGPETADDLLTKICWSGWNMVEGPSHRTKGRGELEDPGDSLDLHYQVSWKLAQRQYSIVTLDGLLQDCCRVAAIPTGERDAEDKSAFKSLVRHLKQMRFVRNQALYRFDPSMWKPALVGSVDSSGTLVSEARYDAHGQASRKQTQDQRARQSAAGTIRHTIWEKAPRS
jgi:hypothetical protein